MNAKTSPKDFFLHLAATIFLYSSVIALINLAFAVANRALPDALQTFYGVGDIVWPISILIVLVPVTYVLEWLISRDIARMPEKRDIWIRRWRIYLTLFLTGVSIVVDLITLINTFLNGEITSRFIIKVAIVLVVSAVVFAYYILAKNAADGSRKMWRTILMWLGVILVLVAVVYGFIIVGSPSKQRASRFDDTRVNDLMNIQGEVISYWQRMGKLPDSLATLNDPVLSYSVPVDPETGASYEYITTGAGSFRLCAAFDTDGSGQSSSYPRSPMGFAAQNNWLHGVGRTCFDRVVYPTLAPVPVSK